MHVLRKYWYIGALILAAFIISLSFVFGGWAGKQLSPPASAIQSSQSTRTTGGSPVKTSTPSTTTQTSLVIPAIGVNAPIEPVGKSAAGSMEVPVRNPWTGVGWYKYGSRPGEQGSAVLDGHLDRPGGAPAVFWRIHSLHIGSTILLVQHGKKTKVFRVVEMANYSPQNAPLARIFRNTTGAFLNLITCSGIWIPQLHQTTLRLVVYTVLISQ